MANCEVCGDSTSNDDEVTKTYCTGHTLTPKEQRALVLRIDRKRAKALRLVQDAERAMADAREDVITAGFGPEMKQGFTDAIIKLGEAARLVEKV